MAYKPPHIIPEIEYMIRLKTLMDKLMLTEKADRSQTKELFELYNDRMAPRETKMQCSGCRSRVYKKMKAYYLTIKGE